MFPSFAFTLMTAPSSYIAYFDGNRLGRSPSGITQVPPPGENDRPQWHTSRVSFEAFVIVCLHESPTRAPWGTKRNSRTSWIPPRSSVGLVSFTVFAFVTSAAHSPDQAFGCGRTVSSGP